MINPIKAKAERSTSYRMQNDKYIYGITIPLTMKTLPVYWRSDLSGKNCRILKTMIPPIKAIIIEFNLTKEIGERVGQMKTEYSIKGIPEKGSMSYRSHPPYCNFMYGIITRTELNKTYPKFGLVNYVRFNIKSHTVKRLEAEDVRTRNREIRKIIKHFNLFEKLDKLEDSTNV